MAKVKTKDLFSVLFIIFQRLSSLQIKCILLQEIADKGTLGDVITSCLACCWGHVNYENIDLRKYVWSRLHFVDHFSRKELKDLGVFVSSLWSDFAPSAWYTSGHRRPQGSVRSDAILNSTSNHRSCRSELALWKKVYLLEGMDFQQFWQILTVTQFHTQQLSICTLNRLQTLFFANLDDLVLQPYAEDCVCSCSCCILSTILSTCFLLAKWGHFWEVALTTWKECLKVKMWFWLRFGLGLG